MKICCMLKKRIEYFAIETIDEATFSTEINKVLLQKHATINIDYKCSIVQDKEGRGGHNKEKIMLNVNTFKYLCLKADTKKANEIHKYYIKLEKLLNDKIISFIQGDMRKLAAIYNMYNKQNNILKKYYVLKKRKFQNSSKKWLTLVIKIELADTKSLKFKNFQSHFVLN